MADINLLPSSLRRHRQPKTKEEKNKDALGRPFFSYVLIFSLLSSAIWLIFFVQVKTKEIALNALTKKLRGVNTDYQKIDALIKRKKELNERISSYEKIFERKILWTKKLSLINQLIPEQVWLTEISTEIKPMRILLIKGSATSLIESEIISAISQLAGQLKENPVFQKDFSEIKLGPLLSQKKGNFTVMNFSLICKFKQ